MSTALSLNDFKQGGLHGSQASLTYMQENITVKTWMERSFFFLYKNMWEVYLCAYVYFCEFALSGFCAQVWVCVFVFAEVMYTEEFNQVPHTDLQVQIQQE